MSRKIPEKTNKYATTPFIWLFENKIMVQQEIDHKRGKDRVLNEQ
ncbi:hypothetical protein FM120_15445 [Sphingobacterium faecium PCAi_F2.5]|nr:hypothetical protein FM120_15445 [Sphingobacterium faecium PCAi_F2.5]